MNTLSCVCNDNYKGSRCEHFALQSFSPDPQEAGLIAGVVILVIVILAVLAAVIYYVYRLKAKNQNPKNKPEEYWRVKSNYDPSSRWTLAHYIGYIFLRVLYVMKERQV